MGVKWSEQACRDSVANDWKEKARDQETKEMIEKKVAARPCVGSNLMRLIVRGDWQRRCSMLGVRRATKTWSDLCQ